MIARSHLVSSIRWKLSVVNSRWRNRLYYIRKAPSVYRNWWAMILVNVLATPVVLDLRNGLRYFIRPGTTDRSVVNEAIILNPYLAPGYLKLPRDAIVVDVGANIGDFSILAAHLCPKGTVYAIEPIKEHVDAILTQTLLNHTENIKIFHLALGDREGWTQIHKNGGHSSGYWGTGDVESVRVTSLEQLVMENDIVWIDLLKLDCEGAEWDILPAAVSVLPRVKQLCMEYHNGKLDATWLAGWLGDRGYEVRYTRSGWNGLLWAWRKADPI
jgi:FkbM family methyltransferase